MHCGRIDPILATVASRFGWDDYAYSFSTKNYIDEHCDDAPFVCEASPRKLHFIEEYHRRGLWGHNPVPQLALGSDVPQVFVYRNIARTGSPGEAEVFELIQRMKWKSCLAIPVHGFGGALGFVTLNSASDPVAPRAVEGTLTMLSPWLCHFNAWAREVLREHNTSSTLTQREMECLQLVAKGKTSRDIAAILSITKRTADFHIRNAMQKLGGATRSQAASALSRLLIANPSLARPGTQASGF